MATLLAAAGCGGPGRVEFVSGQCRIDGRPATLAEVEARQARISERILGRQPLFVVITVLIVALAGFSHVEKLLLLFSTRHSQAHGLAERLKLALERYRAHPVRYFVLVAGTLSLLGIAAAVYVYLDADKRASERALGQLQFCHLALRNGESQNLLAEERRNLQAIEATAGNIQALVDKLPPAEQRKARQIVSEIDAALAQQAKLVGDYAARTDESTRAMRAEAENLQRGLTTLGTQVVGLKSLPTSMRELGEALHGVDARMAAGMQGTDAKLAAVQARLDGIDRALAQLAGRDEAAHAPASAAKLEAKRTEPAGAEPANAEPARSEPIKSDAAKTPAAPESRATAGGATAAHP